MHKINLDQIQEGINSRQLNVSRQQPKLTEQQERVREETWATLTEIYGSSLVNQYGTSMPKAWVKLLTGLTQRNISDGLNALSTRSYTGPPNGEEFRNLCLGLKFDKNGNDITHQHKGAAYKLYKPEKLIEDKTYISKRKKAGKAVLQDILSKPFLTAKERKKKLNIKDKEADE